MSDKIMYKNIIKGMAAKIKSESRITERIIKIN